MIEHYQKYYWKSGKPYGKEKTFSDEAITYKIVIDPYHKRYSLEKYLAGKFKEIIYDSIFLDFRHLNPSEQTAWQKEQIHEQANAITYLIRNHEDRAILIETQYFEKNWCRYCEIRSIHHVLISTHRMYYKQFNDTFNGVVLYDKEERPVMIKTYDIDPQTGEFTTLLTEEWDMQHPSPLLTMDAH